MKTAGICCGSAGVYNLTHPEMSGRLRERKVEQALVSQPDVIVSANPGCILQLRTGLRARGLEKKVRVRHIVELLDAAYGGRPLS